MKNSITQFCFIFIFIVSIVNAQWSNDPDENLRITNWGRYPLVSVSDNSGGIFISVNQDEIIDDSISGSRCWLLHLDNYGNHLLNPAVHWAGEGQYQSNIKMLPSKDGGFVSCLIDNYFEKYVHPKDIWKGKTIVQKVDSNDQILWNGGINVSADTLYHDDCNVYYLESDEIIVSWTSYDVSREGNVRPKFGGQFIQKISSDGKLEWGEKGITIWKEDEIFKPYQYPPVIYSDGSKLITLFKDSYSNDYLKCYNLDGDSLWQIEIRTPHLYSEILPSPDNNLFLIGLSDIYDNIYRDLLIDKIDSNGSYFWESSKVLVDSIGIESNISDWIKDETGNIFVYWSDNNYVIKGTYDSYLQKIDTEGNFEFEDKGKRAFEGDTFSGSILQSFDDFIILSGSVAQKISRAGELFWGSDGLFFSNRTNLSFIQYVTDSNGGFISIWVEGITGIYGQQVSLNGKLGEILTSISENDIETSTNKLLLEVFPNPFNTSCIISFITKSTGMIDLSIYDILGQKVMTLIHKMVDQKRYLINFNASNLSSGIYLANLRANSSSVTKKILLLK